MRNADFNTAAMTATAPTASTRPTAGIGGSGTQFGAQFGGVFGSVQEEVSSFIQNGGGDSFGAGNDAHAFASGLAKGGYATDPAYAAKLSRLAGKLQGISG